MIRAIASYFKSIPAIRRFGRATRLREKGQNAEALKLGREALEILRRPGIIRTNPAEGAALSCATILVEELAEQLGLPGAESADVSDTLAAIRANGPQSELHPWVPYLEDRLAQRDAGAA
jgi:hypothetical protein